MGKIGVNQKILYSGHDLAVPGTVRKKLWNRGFTTGSYFDSSLYPLQHLPFSL